MGKWLDWVKVKRFLDKNYEVIGARYYVGVRKRALKMRKFLSKLRRIGFKVITKPVKKIIDEIGRELEKANFDVEITADILTSMNKVGIVVLFSGDSDFEYLVKILHKKEKKLYVYSSKRTLSWELKLKADKCFLLEKLRSLTKGRRFARVQLVFGTPSQGWGFFISALQAIFPPARLWRGLKRRRVGKYTNSSW